MAADDAESDAPSPPEAAASDHSNHEPQQQEPNDDEDDEPEVRTIAVEEILYGMDSFYAIVQPVLLTMTASAVAVVYINTPAFQQATQQGLSQTYAVSGNASNATTTGRQLSSALLNALVIVAVICVMTVVIVLLYRYRCMKILWGYMILASTLLLGYLSSVMFQVAIQRYQLKIDTISFWLFIYNLALVGIVSIFFAQALRIPSYITQFYLMLSSVIIAWQMSNWDPWTGWLLLVCLALYDLFAVLTPCGPLKALVRLMQREDAPALPGLLYEANLQPRQSRPRQPISSAGAAAPSRMQQSTTPSQNETTATEQDGGTETSAAESTMTTTTTTTQPEDFTTRSSHAILDGEHLKESSGCEKMEHEHQIFDVAKATSADDATTAIQEDSYPHFDGNIQTTTGETTFRSTLDVPNTTTNELPIQTSILALSPNSGCDDEHRPRVQSTPIDVDALLEDEPEAPPTGEIPLALAIQYRLPLADDPHPSWMDRPSRRTRNSPSQEEEEAAPDHQQDGAEQPQYTAQELQSLVTVVFHPRGGRIVPHVRQRRNEETRYAVVDRNGVLRRILFINASDGVVYQDNREQNEREEARERTTIKLGLGDFIFYSILVSKAAVYSYTTFVVCTLAILAGLGLTLLLLAVYKQALPALPISIFLGIIFFLLTRYAIEPWAKEVFIQQGYV